MNAAPVTASFATAAASWVVLAAGLYLVALGLLCAARPSIAVPFLGAFASTPRLHAAEIVVRIIVGAALVHRAPAMHMQAAFSMAGWILIVSSAVLAVTPWRMHRRFARATVPRAVRYLPLVAAASVAGGAFVIWAWSATLANASR